MAKIFEFQEYKTYLTEFLDEQAKSERGARTRLAQALRCESSHITRVLNGKAHLTPEQADRANRFLKHTHDESVYLFLLIQFAQAGTLELRQFLQEQIDQQQEQHLNLKKRFKVKEQLSEQDQQTYYSSWHYGAIAIALHVPQYQSREAMAQYFKLDTKKISEVLEFLVRTGIAQYQSGRYKPGNTWLHLGKDSPLSVKNHVNWRLQSIRALEDQHESDVHYSATFNLSQKDVFKMRALLVESLEESRKVIKASGEETVHCLTLDFFEL